MSITRVVIVSGGHVDASLLAMIQPSDYIIGADRGAYRLCQANIRLHLAIGDFDSVTPEQFACIVQHSEAVQRFDAVDKDYTDTELAVQTAIARQPNEILLLGALGTRFDHSIANIHLLTQAAQANVTMAIVNEHNAIRLVTSHHSLTVTKSHFAQVSLLPLTQTVRGIDLEGFQYPLQQAQLIIGQSLGISNILIASQGTITIQEGLLLVIESID